MDAGSFTNDDNYDDVAIIKDGVVRVYRNLFNGTLDANPNILSNVTNARN